MGIPLLHGRAFGELDTLGLPPVVIVNAALARRLWPGENPLGKRLRSRRGDEQEMEVVGVVGNSLYRTWSETPSAILYLPFEQRYLGSTTLHLYVEGTPASFREAIRREVGLLDKDLPVFNLRTMKAHLGQVLQARQTGAELLSLLGFLALSLAAIGIYGAFFYWIAQRTREMGIRLALGAGTVDILALVLGRGLRLSLLGIGIGLAASYLLARLVSGLLFGIAPTDPVTFATVALSLLAVALLACYVPARRATKVDPMVALRYE